MHDISTRTLLPAEHDPMMRPFRCLGDLVSFTSSHPNAEPITNVIRMFTGINHLHKKRSRSKKEIAPQKRITNKASSSNIIIGMNKRENSQGKKAFEGDCLR